MRIGCGVACACINTCFDYTSQGFSVVLLTCDSIIRDTEAFQKTCILAHSVFVGWNLYYQTNHFPQLIAILDLSQSFDFFGFFRLPRYILHIYTAQRIDEYALLDQLEALLCDKWDIGEEDENGNLRDLDVRLFAQQQLTSFLLQMVEDDIDYQSEEEMQTVLKNWLSLAIKKEDMLDTHGYDPDIIDLSTLTIELKTFSLLEKWADIAFIFVDIVCVPDFLQEWELIDLSTISNYMYSFRVFGWLPQVSLDETVRSLMCFGFMLQVIEALRCLAKQDLQSEEKKAARWTLAASGAELLYNMAILQKKDLRVITFLAFIAKSIGVARFLIESQSSFFADDAIA